MAAKNPKPSEEPQRYDNTLKTLFGDEANTVIPCFVPEVSGISEENIEIDRSKLRADIVKKVYFNGKPGILNMELQVSAEKNIVQRLLVYHSVLHFRHNLPVKSVILYPFEVPSHQSPYEEKLDDETELLFYYKKISLLELDATVYTEQHIVAMYTLLPGMKNATVPL